MKAIVFNQYGSVEVLQSADIKKPLLKSNQILVKVHATSVNPIDWKVRSGKYKLFSGAQFPHVVGSDIAGEVVEVGKKVTYFKPGDLIYALLNPMLGGACAEYAAVFEGSASLKPENLTFEQAAAVPATALTALQALRDQGRIQSGQKVLINGGSGGVGVFAVQIAKALGTEVTEVCSTKKLALMTTLGADHVIDYTVQDFTRDTVRYDIIFDAVSKQSFSNCKRVLQTKGIYIRTLPTLASFLQSFLPAWLPGKRAKSLIAKASGSDLAYLKTWIEAGQIRTVIDRSYPLSEIAAAHTYSEAGHAVGKIVITVYPAD